MFLMTALYLWDIILLEIKYVHALTVRDFYENHPVIHKMYPSYGKIYLVIPKTVVVGVTYFTLFCFFKVLVGISLA